jgi:membrane protease YdiL (CAAX protease family)
MKNTSLKTQLLSFLILTFTISWCEVYFIVSSEAGIHNTARALALMWTPGVVGLVLSWVFGWRFKDIGFKIGNWRHYLVSYAVPAVTSLLILFALLLFGLGDFEISPKLIERSGSFQAALVKILVLSPIFGALFGFFSGLGEEIGWRGFLHSRIIELKWPHPYLLTGIVWAVWHWPLILFSNYATSDLPILSVALFTVMVTSLSVFMGWMRTKSGSVFTAALIHGSHNLWIQAIYPAFLKKGPLDAYFGGESGVFNALFYFLMAVFIYRKFLKRGQPVPAI